MAKELAKKPTSAVKTTKATATKTVNYLPAEEVHSEGDHPIAITSMILGVVSLTTLGPITGIPAVILGIIGLNKSSRKGLSIAGIVTGAVSILITFIIVSLIFLLFIASAYEVEYTTDPATQPTPQNTIYNET